MKHTSSLLALFVLSLLWIAGAPTDETPAEHLRTHVGHALQQWALGLEQLEQATTSNLADAQAAFESSRMQYKKVEWLAEYFQPEFCKDYINGAPLPRIERNAPGVPVVAPQGYQRLEEELFGEENLEQAHELAHELNKRGAELVAMVLGTKWYDRHFFEAAQQEVVRLMALGITGFDNPVRDQAIEETAVAFDALAGAMLVYSKHVKPAIWAPVQEGFAAGEGILETRDFEQFNRAAFIRNALDPLFAGLRKMQETLGVETRKEVVFVEEPLNYGAAHLFSDELVNPYAFVQLPRAQHTTELIALGRTLFFDPLLSADLTRSCASCHKPEKAFTDGVAKSLATGSGTVTRNSPTLVNVATSTHYFYDLRVEHLENQVEHVITSEKEFNTSYAVLEARLKESPAYRALFAAALPQVPEANRFGKYGISTALAAYVSTLMGMNSPVDAYLRKESAHLEGEVEKGFNLFMGKAACGTCHFAPVFNGSVPPLYNDTEAEVLGVPATADKQTATLDHDLGKMAGVLKQHAAIYANAFKTVTVRNAALTGPYMHNGVFGTLDEVVSFYNDGGGAGWGLDVPNQTLPFDSLQLNDAEQKALVKFMEALVDNPPFVRPELPRDFRNKDWNNRPTGGVY